MNVLHPAERHRIAELVAQGLGVRAIARRLGVSRCTIRKYRIPGASPRDLSPQQRFLERARLLAVQAHQELEVLCNVDPLDGTFGKLFAYIHAGCIQHPEAEPWEEAFSEDEEGCSLCRAARSAAARRHHARRRADTRRLEAEPQTPVVAERRTGAPFELHKEFA